MAGAAGRAGGRGATGTTSSDVSSCAVGGADSGGTVRTPWQWGQRTFLPAYCSVTLRVFPQEGQLMAAMNGPRKRLWNDKAGARRRRCDDITGKVGESTIRLRPPPFAPAWAVR